MNRATAKNPSCNSGNVLILAGKALLKARVLVGFRQLGRYASRSSGTSLLTSDPGK